MFFYGQKVLAILISIRLFGCAPVPCAQCTKSLQISPIQHAVSINVSHLFRKTIALIFTCVPERNIVSINISITVEVARHLKRYFGNLLNISKLIYRP